MDVTLVRSRPIASVFKLANTISSFGYDVNLLIWDRRNTGNKQFTARKNYSLSKFSLKAPENSIKVAFFLPLWWIYLIIFLLKEDNIIIHCCDFDTLIPCIIVKKIKKTKLSYTIFDFYADNFPEKIPKILKKLVGKFEKSLIKYTDVLFLVDESRFQQVKGASIKNLFYIYNSPPDYYKKKTIKKSNNHLTIFYAGFIDQTRGINYVIDAIQKIPNVNLFLAGTGRYINSLLKKEKKIKNIKYLGEISYKKVLSHTMKCDIMFAFYDPAIPNNRFASPNKLFEAMMAGVPIVTNDNTSMAKIVRENNCGIVIPFGNVDSIIEAFITLKSNPSLRYKLGNNGRNAYENMYSWKKMEKKIRDAYRLLA